MTCHICGAKLAESLLGRENHMRLYHAVIPAKRVHRPKDEIVRLFEARIGHFLIDGSAKECSPHCRCSKCFQAHLDRLVSSTEEATDACRISLGLNNELPSNEL